MKYFFLNNENEKFKLKIKFEFLYLNSLPQNLKKRNGQDHTGYFLRPFYFKDFVKNPF